MDILNYLFALPFLVQIPTSILMLLVFFLFVIRLKLALQGTVRRGGIKGKLAKIILYYFAIIFILADVGVNVIYLPFVYLELPNKYKEGWLVTSRLQYHFASKGWTWQKKVSVFLCKWVEAIDPNHCTTSRFK